MKKFKEWRGTALMKKLKRFFASILCICMIITSCPDLLAWAAGDTAVVKPVTYRLTANSLSKMVRKAELEKTEENGLCKLKLPKGFNKTLGKTKLHVYLQPDEDSLVFVFENKADKRQGAALIVDNKKSDIFAIPTKAEIYEELGYEYASDSNADEEEIDSEGLLGDDFQDLEAEIVDDAATGSDNNADEKYDYLEGYATHTILNNKKHTTGVTFVVSLDDLGMDSLGELLPDEDDEITATDSNAETVVPGETKPEKPTTTVPAEVPTTTPSNPTVTTPSNATVVTVATPSNVAKTFIADVNGVTIRAHAEAGVLPEAATFQAIELKETGKTADAFKEACKTLDDAEDTEYDGVMAYDLHFLLDGEEVQPNGEVEITMEVSQKALPTDVDPSTIEAKHLAEDGDTLQVQTVADTADKVEGTVEVKEDVVATLQTEASSLTKAEQNATAVKAEFKVDSFSYFAITFKKKNTIKAYIVNSKGEDIPLSGADANDEVHIGGYGKSNAVIFDPTDFGAQWESGNGWGSEARQDKWISIKVVADAYGRYTEEYTYSRAQINKPGENVTAQEIKWIYYNLKGNTWYYSNADSRPTSFNTKDANTKVLSEPGSNDSKIYLVYNATNVNRDIIDEIATQGHLTIRYEGASDKTYTFKWYGSDNGITWSQEPIERKRVQGENYNIDYNGHSSYLYPALDLSNNLNTDKTIRRWYKAEVWDGNTKLREYPKYQIPYFAAIQNGGFEDIKIDGDEGVNPSTTTSSNKGNYTFPNGYTGLIWKTTGADEQIEIADVTHEGDKRYNCSQAKDGTQFAELNAEQAGSLYQVVLTQPGSKLNWEFYHKGRYGADTMYMFIAAADQLGTITDQIAQGVTPNVDGSKYLEVTSQTSAGWYYNNKQKKQYSQYGPGDWKKHSSAEEGTYTVPEGQYLTVFFFVAKSTSTKSKTEGNLLDKVSFGTQPLVPSEETGTLRVTKCVEGISETDIQNYSVEIKLYNSNSEVVRSANIGFESGNPTNAIEFTDLLPDNYQIEEIPVFGGTTGNAYTQVESKLQVDNTNTKINENNSITKSSIGRIEANRTKQITFINKYAPQYRTLSVTKMVKGNMGNNSDSFNFKLEAEGNISKIAGEYSVVKSNGSTENRTVNTDGTFALSGGETITITKIPYGATISVTETSTDGYETTYLVDTTEGTETKGCSHSFSNMTENHSILFINTRTVIIPTGLFDHGKPTGWWFLMVMAAGCLGFGAYRRKKKRDDREERL